MKDYNNLFVDLIRKESIDICEQLTAHPLKKGGRTSRLEMLSANGKRRSIVSKVFVGIVGILTTYLFLTIDLASAFRPNELAGGHSDLEIRALNFFAYQFTLGDLINQLVIMTGIVILTALLGGLVACLRTL